MGTPVAVATVAAVFATVAFLVGGRRRRDHGGRRAQGAATLSRAFAPVPPLLVAALLLSGVVPVQDLLAWGLFAWAITLPWLARTDTWSVTAHAGWSLTVAAGGLYIVAMAAWTATSGLTWLGLVGGWILWLLELAAYVLLLAYGWEIYESIGSRHWGRRLPPQRAELHAGDTAPFVSIHVPSHNEPPDLVIATLQSLLDLDYPAYEVLVVDNNTTDDSLWPPVAQFCAHHPDVLRFHRLVDWPGYKSGALNYAREHTDPRASIIGVVDADYQVDATWLVRTVGAFRDPEVGFVQTPQDYRDWHHAAYLRRLYYSYDFFFTVSQRSRDERGGAIFGGTMGLVRRQALDAVGGWDEWCVTEDAELSLRLLERGWTGHHLDESYGHGLMPLTFEALKRQRFRWCFGGMQILKMHWRSLLPWNGDSGLSRSQRLAYVSGGVQWFGDLLSLAFAVLVMASIVDQAMGHGFMVRRLAGLLLVAVPALILMGVVRAVATVKTVGRGITWRDAAGVFLIWMSLGWVVSMASVRGLVEPEGVFMRTPKVREDIHWIDIIRAHRGEMLLLALAVGSTLTGAVLHPTPTVGLLAALLVVPMAGWAAAPLFSVAALRADLPDELSRIRSRERARDRRQARRAAISVGSLAAAGAATLLVLTVVQPGSTQQPRQSLGPVVVLHRSGEASSANRTGSDATSATSPMTASSTTSRAIPSATSTPPPTSTSSSATTSSSSSTSTSTTTQPGSATGTPTRSASSTTHTTPPRPTSTGPATTHP